MRFVAPVVVLGLLVACTSPVTPASRGLAGRSAPASPSTHPSPRTTSATMPPAMLIWTQNGLPPGFAQRVAGMPGVRSSVTVVPGTVWLT